jgi:hypothetical protein
MGLALMMLTLDLLTVAALLTAMMGDFEPRR